MARAKVKCKGRNKDGTPCRNWAVQGSFYCHLHQNQVTAKDQEEMKKAKAISAFITFIIMILWLIFKYA